MKYYLDITLLQTTEDMLNFLWQKVYMQVHLALVEVKDLDGGVPVAISFPEYHYEPKKARCLGSKLRLFAQNRAVLEQLDLSKWLARLADYVSCASIYEVPLSRVVKYTQFRRFRIKGPEKLARRYAERHSITFEEALMYYQSKSNVSDLPYVQLKSLSNHQDFRLYIEKREHSELIQDGFSTYGLSHRSTVPEF